MIKRIYILLLATLALFIGPMQSFGGVDWDEPASCCAAHTTEPCSDHSGCEDMHKGCDGECNCAGCTCVVHLPSTPLFVFQNDDSSFLASFENKEGFFFLKQFVPAVFYSIWIPPKIG